MRMDIARSGSESTTLTCESLEGLVREKVHELIQEILEEDVTTLLIRQKSEQKAAVEPASGSTATASPMARVLQSKGIPGGQSAESARA